MIKSAEIPEFYYFSVRIKLLSKSAEIPEFFVEFGDHLATQIPSSVRTPEIFLIIWQTVDHTDKTPES